MNIYLDINGVVLKNDLTPAPHLKKFLTLMLEKHQVFWLTTHCQGDGEVTVDYLARFFPEEYLELFRKIKPTKWNVLKTDAIDFSKPFLWFDDQLFDFEKADLVKHGVLDSWIEVDFSKDIDQLEKIVRNFPARQ